MWLCPFSCQEWDGGAEPPVLVLLPCLGALSSVESGQEGPQVLLSSWEVTKPGHPVAEPCQDPVLPQPSPRAAGSTPGEAGSSCLQPC